MELSVESVVFYRSKAVEQAVGHRLLAVIQGQLNFGG